jgi:23S rRNA pseudouridine1911/1915/1917 synthase
VHRLDKDTSGLMVVGKTLAAVTSLVRDIAERAVQREYVALAHGTWKQEGTTTIDAPIGRDPKSRVRMAVVAGGKPARTDVTLVAANDGISALRCKLRTGRTHQIRVHLASRGHPLLADATYGGRPLLGLARQALHAARLGLNHPETGQLLQFEAPLPPDLAAAWDRVIR